MIKPLLATVCAALLVAHSALGQITLTASPSAQTIDVTSNNLFNVTISISGAPADMIGFDLWLETIAANSGYFSIVGATPAAGSPFDFPSGSGVYPDVINTGNSVRSGFAQNAASQGFTSSAPTTYNGPLVTLELAVNAGTPADGTTYNFSTTQFGTSGNKGSSVSTFDGNNTGTQFVDNPATFSVTVVPEPATWSLLALGAIGAFGVRYAKRQRKE